MERTRRHCWRVTSTRYKAQKIHEEGRSGRVSVSFHGWMWSAEPGELVTIDGHLNAEQYINILETSLLPSVRAYALPESHTIRLVQDRSPIHTSHAVRDWFELLDWPSKGCDCNPIKNLWGMMVREWEVADKTRQAVENKADVWESNRRQPNICSNLFQSVPARLQEVIAANGGWTKY